MSIAELQHIEKLAATVPEHGKVLEIGSFYGRSTWAWAKSIPASATVHCIDPWNGWPITEASKQTMAGIVPPGDMLTVLPPFLENTSDCPNVSYTQDYSQHVLPDLDYGQYDVIFIDGLHSNPGFHNDLIMCCPLVKKGGILSGHDFNHADWPVIFNEVTNLSTRLGIPIDRHPQSLIWALQL